MSALHIVILAAGQGTRMHSDLPKVLHRLAGRPLLQYIIETAQHLNPEKIHLVHAPQHAALLQQTFSQPIIQWVEQNEQLGTGHAVQQALPFIPSQAQVLILCGDVPFISKQTLTQLLAQADSNELSLLTAILSDPQGYGRVIRDASGHITHIVEEKEATAEQLTIKEVSTGIVCARGELLQRYLPKLGNQNSQQEYYLPEIFNFACQDQLTIASVTSKNPWEIRGINSKNQLIALERYYQRIQAENCLHGGVLIRDPNRFDLRGTLRTGRNVDIDVNAVLEGDIILGDDVVIEPQVILRNVKIGNGVRIRANSVLEDCEILSGAVVGPFARIRPGTILGEGAQVGNFVEVKKSVIGEGSKISHLSYVGDSQIGKQVNIGAGTITCNYDGAYKHKTMIGDHVFVGSGTQLVAPLEIGEGATIAAGSTVRKNVEAHTLTTTQQLRQRSMPGWQRPKKEED